MKKSAFRMILALGICIALLFSAASVAQAKTQDVPMYAYSIYTSAGTEGTHTYEEWFLVFADGVWEPEMAVTNVQFEVTVGSFCMTFDGTLDGANWRAWFNISQFGGYKGTYNIKVYAIDALGRRGYLGSTSIYIIPDSGSPPASAAGSNAAPSQGAVFKVYASGMPKSADVNGVSFRAYCSNNMSDEYWYTGTYLGNGNWTATINIANHQNHLGQYTVDAFAVNAANGNNYVGTSFVTVQ